jgi:ankyrin repeat protein
VELQLDLFISLERPIKHWKDFDDRLKKLEHDHDSGREVVDRLGETYEEIFQRNVQGAHSQRLAVRALQWVLCAFRPFDIQELRAAIAVEDLDVTVKLLLDLCSNFIHVDSKGFVRLAHISVKEYLEMKKIEDVLKFSYVEAHAQAAMTCFLYWSCAFEKEIGPPIRKEALLRTGSLFLKQIVSQQPPSFDKDKYIRKRCTALTCSEKVQGMEETALGEAATASWRCYASLYWASHYENATGDTLDQTSESMLKRKLSSFLDGRQYNIALINWVKEMAQLRYAFRQNGAGLGDRTPSPGPVPFTRSLSRAPSPFHVNYQISHITTKARVPPAAALPNPGRRGFSNTSLGTPVTSPSYLGRVVWDPTQALDAAQSRPHTRSIPRPRYHSLSLSPASSCKGREKEEKHPKEEMEFQRPREKKRALEGKKRIEKEAKEAGVQSRLEEVSRKVGLNEQLTAKEETKIWEAPLYLEDFPARMLHRREISPMTKKRHIKVEPRQKWYTSSSSDSSTTPSREVSAQPKSGRRYGGRPLPVLWLSDFAYDKDRTVFWDQWQDVSNFPPEGVEKGIRRIAFLTACLYGFEDVVSSVCNLKRCVRYRSHKGHSGLQLAARNGFLGIVRLLVEHGMKDEVDAGTTALHEACEGGHINVIECLLSAHFPPNRAQNRSYINTKDINGRSPLHLAAENDQSAIVVLLLQQPDIDVNARDQFRATSLRAAWKYSKKTLGILLEDPRVDTQIEDIYGKKYNDA